MGTFFFLFFFVFAIIGVCRIGKLAKDNPTTSMKAASFFTSWLNK